MLSLESNRISSLGEPRRPDVFEQGDITSIRFPHEEEIQAIQEKRACLSIPYVDRVIKIAEQWKMHLRENGETKANAYDAFNKLLDQVFPALTTNANDSDRSYASHALEEPVLDLFQTGRCNGGKLSMVGARAKRRELHSEKNQ